MSVLQPIEVKHISGINGLVLCFWGAESAALPQLWVRLPNSTWDQSGASIRELFPTHHTSLPWYKPVSQSC